MTISKLDAARRQLEMASRLYFHGGDPVSVHTLTAAGYNILHDLSKFRAKQPMLVKDRVMERVKPGREKEVWARLVEAENFFKHANKDPEGSLEFSEFQTEVLLFDAACQYFTLTGETVPLLRLFEGWFMLHNTDFFDLPAEMDRVVRSVGPEFASLPRNEYFQLLLPSLLAAGT